MHIALFLFALSITFSCSTATRQLFFDIPPPSEEELARRALKEANATASSGNEDQESDRLSMPFSSTGDQQPPVESLESWEEVLAALPRDYKKAADWSAAVKQKLIQPRFGPDPSSQYAVGFDYDFIIPAEKPKNEAYFPHSAHTDWLSCNNCHVKLYPYKRNPATMKEMRSGASCGACHGRVAFPLTYCKRCHLQR